MSSNVRVYVHWKYPVVFSGEDLECTIVFKNVAPILRPSRGPISPSEIASNRQRQQNPAPLQTSTRSAAGPTVPISGVTPPRGRGHRPTVSLNAPLSNEKVPGPGSRTRDQHDIAAFGQKHRRSVSIISLGGLVKGGEDSEGGGGPGQAAAARRSGRNHVRSASLQVLPRWSANGEGGPASAPLNLRTTNHYSPLFSPSRSPTSSEPNAAYPLPYRHGRRFSGTGFPPHSPERPIYAKHPSGSSTPSFRFPSTSPTSNYAIVEAHDLAELAVNSYDVPGPPKARSPMQLDDRSSQTEHLRPNTKILSGSSMNGTPRSSAEFYSMSNNSTETLASECAPQPSNLFAIGPRRPKQLVQHAPLTTSRSEEVLMMGYAQVVGSFTLDGSLVNRAPFEEIKRKAVLGGQGAGGVVGVEKSKSNSGLFGALGWASIGESIGGLLGDRELSSIKEMRELANSKSVPLLSTPKSILFVNLHLAPGESKSYNYSYRLPRGLPPSHKGKAFKVFYQLVLGTQRASMPKEQQSVRHVNVPFRVLGSVDAQGEILGHDLMSPHIPLRDQARVSSLEKSSLVSERKHVTGAAHEVTDASLQGFLSYVHSILDRPRENSSLGLLSPTASRPTREPHDLEEPTTMKDAIDLAILRSNVATSSNRNTNRFEIARNGQLVAVLMLTRSAYRLGETITAAVDLSGADIPCYSVYGTLETSESVDPAIALRSSASIHRVTRRIHASHIENTLFAHKVIFSPKIPATATPEFLTSGVSLEWKLRIRFVTPRLSGGKENAGQGQSLLEEVSKDDRGMVKAAIESLACESFEIAVPLRVYGVVTDWSESNEIEGLPV